MGTGVLVTQKRGQLLSDLKGYVEVNYDLQRVVSSH